ncbi:sugar porter family MFS transporter [Amycolatopsis jejuensis]|uniref:sugar porter family MFS transporter n=1 Tax=Amycolatopsis jejuensis TaxID=330084 RepID=UPI00068EB627|nr:sugar porter family MFS transporter [Amycolatopsis jejuensis]
MNEQLRVPATTSAVTRSGLSRVTLRIVAGALMVGFVYGYDQGSIAGAALFLTAQFGLTPFDISVIVTAVPVGTFAGAIVAGKVTNRIGRKRSIMAIAVGFAVFSALQGFAVDMWTLAAVRMGLGLVVGISLVAAPQFIAESTTTRVRGSALVSFQIAGAVGLVVSYLVSVALAPGENWRLILGLAAIPGVLAVFVLRPLPDTPHWYLAKGRRSDAARVLRAVEPGDDPETHLGRIEEDLKSVGSDTYKQLLKPPMRRAGIFAVGLGLLVQVTGINAIVYYSPAILTDIGFGSAQGALLGSAVLQMIGLAAVCVAFLVVDRWGRRPVLMSGITVMIVANAVLMIAFTIGDAKFLGAVGVALFLIGFQFGYGALVWVYAAESLPAQLRAVGASVLMAADLFGNIVVGIFFPNAMAAMGGTATFGLFLVMSVIALAFIAKLAPEVKGRQLEEIREYWERGGRWAQRPERRPAQSEVDSRTRSSDG